MSNLAAAVQDAVTTAIDHDEVDLPTLPEVALDVREAAGNENITGAGLAKVIAVDPGLAARLVKIANSPMFRAAKPIEDLQMAISRLGVEYAANLAVGLAMQQMFQATSDHIDRKLRAVWNRSTRVAAISNVFAKHYTALKPDQAALAGLVHSIGVLPILSWAEENDYMITDSIALDGVIDALHGKLGARILNAWEFSPEIANVPLEYHNLHREPEQVDYADIIQVAFLQSHAGTSHPCAKLDWTTIGAFERVGLDPQVPTGEIEDLREDLEAAKLALC